MAQSLIKKQYTTSKTNLLEPKGWAILSAQKKTKRLSQSYSNKLH
jgi:hypothetical protein